jgi:hypothetical protein
MRLSALGIGGLGILVACAQAPAENAGTSEAAHTEGELTWDNQPYSWSTLSVAEADQIMAASDQKGESLAEDHPISVRMQAWVDKFDEEVRQIVLKKTGKPFAAPKPTVRVVIDPTPNAFIIPLPVYVAQAPAPADTTAKTMIFLTPTLYQETEYGALEASATSWPAAPGPVDWFNKLGGAQLREESSAVVVSDEIRAEKVAVMTMVSLVNIHLALVSSSSEKSVAAVIGHELGHYYRGHSATVSSKEYGEWGKNGPKGFWYDRAQPVNKRPEPVADQAKYQDDYEKLKVPRFLIPTQKIHPRVSSTLISWATQLDTAPGHVCEPVKTEVKSWPKGISNELTVAGGPDITGPARRAYLSLEKKAEACISAIKLVDAASAAGGVWTTNEVPREWFVSRIEQTIKDQTSQEALEATATLSALVDVLTNTAKKLDAQAPEFLKKLADNNIGLYTGEQEADDIAFELSTGLGLSADDVYMSQIELTRAIEKSVPASKMDTWEALNDNMTAAQCEALLKAGFKDDSGKTVYVPIGDLTDPHHAQCYRLFNLYREMEAHKYKSAPENFPKADPPWTTLQKQAADLLKAPSAPKPGKDPGASDDDSDDDDTVVSTTPSDTVVKKKPKTTTTITTTGCNAAPGTSGSGLAIAIGAVALAAARRRRRA